MKSKLVWLLISAFALACNDHDRESSDLDGVGGDIGGGLGKGSGGVGGDIDGGLGKGSGGTGNSTVDTTDPACVGAEPLVLSLTENGEVVNDTGLLEFKATLTSSTDDSAVLETCPGEGGEGEGSEGGAGGAGPSGENGCLTLEIRATGLDVMIDVGTTVNVLWDSVLGSLYGGGGSMVVLRSLGNESIGGFLLGVGNGLPLADSPVTYTSSQLDCVFDGTAFCSARMSYELTFTAVDNPSSSVSLTMGEQDRLELDPNSYTKWRVHNISSMTSGGCDAHDPMRYYVVQET